jgi:hypothetical protein
MLGDVAENTAALDMELGVFPKKPLILAYLQYTLLAPVTFFVRWGRLLEVLLRQEKVR